MFFFYLVDKCSADLLCSILNILVISSETNDQYVYDGSSHLNIFQIP